MKNTGKRIYRIGAVAIIAAVLSACLPGTTVHQECWQVTARDAWANLLLLGGDPCRGTPW